MPLDMQLLSVYTLGFDPSQPRDNGGMWTGGSTGKTLKDYPEHQHDDIRADDKAARKAIAAGPAGKLDAAKAKLNKATAIVDALKAEGEKQRPYDEAAKAAKTASVKKWHQMTPQERTTAHTAHTKAAEAADNLGNASLAAAHRGQAAKFKVGAA